MLNESFGSAVPAVFAEGGTIVQFMGDALMAIFNAPLRQPDHALRACRAALALQQSVAVVSGDRDRPRFGVGINTGRALVGNIGSAELRNFTALGDTTNVAARLQTYAQEGTVVIGERTHELVGDLAEVRSLGTADLKGKSTPTPVYELLGLHESVGQ
jgi:class 3 adenylate cyclase